MSALIVSLTILVATLATFANGQNACANETSSTTTYVANPTSCSAWIACNSGKVVNSGTCNSGYMFDVTSGSCEVASKVTCSSSPLTNICVNQADDSYVADPTNCKGYYYCKNSVGNAGLCNTGYYFNATLKVCVNNPSYVCPNNESGNESSDDACVNVPNGVFLPDETSCSGYYACLNGKAVAGSCGSALYFNPTTGACDYPANVKCSNSGSSSSSSAISVPYDYAKICQSVTTSGGFVSDPANCTGYFYCSASTDTSPSHGYCPSGYEFDSTANKCSNSGVTCTVVPCTNQPVGYFAVDSTSCEKYYYCSAKGAQTGTCPSGYYFDVKNQNCNAQSAVECTITTQ